MSDEQIRKQLLNSLEAVESYLQALKDDGVTAVDADPDLVRSLSAASAPAPRRTTAPAPAPANTALAVPPATRPAASAPAASLEPLRLPDTLEGIAQTIAACTRCRLCNSRNRTVPGQGHPHPEIMFIGEGPGRDEDQQGLAFVGRAGQILTRMITAMGLTRDEVFIGNIVKCRPTVDNAGERDRPPSQDEMESCLPYLRAQIALLKPKAIVALGMTSVKGLFGDHMNGISRLRGQWLAYEGIPVMPTFHPSYLLRQGGEGKQSYWEVWSDLCLVLAKVGREPPKKKGA